MPSHVDERDTATDQRLTISEALLYLYPESFRDKFGGEIQMVFQDAYQEELAMRGTVSLGFWLSALIDLVQSVVAQHADIIRKQGMKSYLQETLQLNKFHVIGAILLLPFAFLLGVDFVGRVIQGDLLRSNAEFAQGLSLWIAGSGQAPLLWIIFVSLPLAAVVLNMIPVIRSRFAPKQAEAATKRLNLLTVAIIVIGLGLVTFAFGHDVIPCLARHLLQNGLNNLPNTLAVCGNA